MNKKENPNVIRFNRSVGRLLTQSSLFVCDPTKKGCVFPMIISSECRMGQYGDDDHREDTLFFKFKPSFIFSCFCVVVFLIMAD